MADGPRLGSTLCRVREFNRLDRVLDEVRAVNGGEDLAMARSTDRRGRELGHQEPAGPYRAHPPGPARQFRYRRRFEAGKALRDREVMKAVQNEAEWRIPQAFGALFVNRRTSSTSTSIYAASGDEDGVQLAICA